MAYEVGPSFASAYKPGIDFESLPPEGGPRLWAGQARSAEGVPKRGILRSSHKKLPDMFYFAGSYVVCEKFREIVERLEPGVHQFFPFEIVTKKGDPVPGPGPFYMLNVTQKLDAVLVSKSKVVWKSSDFAPEKTCPAPDRPLQLVMSRPRIAGHHIWRANTFSRQSLYISNALFDEIESARLKKLMYTHIEESDDIWYAEENVPQWLRDSLG